MNVVKLPNKPLPLLALRDVIIYPNLVMPLFVGRQKSIEAVTKTETSDYKQILLSAQIDPEHEDPGNDDIQRYGTLATMVQLMKLPDGTYRLLVEGKQRVHLTHIIDSDGYLQANYEVLPQSVISDAEAIARVKALKNSFVEYRKVDKSKLAKEIIDGINNELDLTCLIDLMAMHLPLPFATKQGILEQVSLHERAELMMESLKWQQTKSDIDKSIQRQARQQIEKNQRDYYLNEQVKAIKKELNNGTEAEANEHDKLQEQITAAKMPQHALDKAEAELKKLKQLSTMSAEASVTRSYLDWIINLPWSKASKLKKNLNHAQRVLNSDHYGLSDVKQRILEFLAVQKRVNRQHGPILCLVGPPGVGKTSLGESIAKATGRQYVRIALGGVRDEAEIRGHRRTYIGSMPGKIIQKLSRSKTNNPLILLDEIDKLGADYRGDPAAALLEVLDPEQNKAFNDHYIEVDFDLSKAMFVCTANSMAIPEALIDRMEVIRIPGYTEPEKMQISTQYLIPKSLKGHGAKDKELTFKQDGLLEVIRSYTRESGVRNLKREIDKLVRKVITDNVMVKTAGKKTVNLTAKTVGKYLGVVKYRHQQARNKSVVGCVTGLAWTSAGGELLSIEVAALQGTGKVIKTGSLGDVMQESIQAALTVVRSRTAALGVSEDFHSRQDLHIHVPEGATPKDGPSAGIGMCTAIISELTQIAVKSSVAMTGEITLKGEVLPIGGLKEKLLAAHQRGVETVIIPKENEPQLQEIDEKVKKDLTIYAVEWIDEVLDIALITQPQAALSDGSENTKTSKMDTESQASTTAH